MTSSLRATLTLRKPQTRDYPSYGHERVRTTATAQTTIEILRYSRINVLL